MKQENKAALAEQGVKQNQSPEQSRQRAAPALQPMTDIYESKEGVVLYIDLPGVSKKDVALDVDRNVLTVKGRINLQTSEKLEATYMDLRSEQFARQFTLGEELDSSLIEASLEQGLLKLVIPRLEQHKPKKIKVNVA